LIFCLLFIFLMRNKPKNPPSLSKDNYTIMPLKEGIKQLKSNPDFIKLLISLTCVVGFVNIFGTIFNSYMDLYKINDIMATYTAAVSNCFGIVTALIVGCFIDKKKQYKSVMIICNILALVFLIITLMLLETGDKKIIGRAAFFGYTLVLGSAIPIYTAGMDFICEITYPVGESISEGIVMSFNQIMGIIGIIISDCFRIYLKKMKYMTNLFSVLLFFISLTSLYFTNPELKRTQKDLKEIKEENKEKEDN